MKTFKISDPQGVYTTSYFILTSSGEVYADNEEIGFFKHPTITDEAKLLEHLKRMKTFKIDIFY